MSGPLDMGFYDRLGRMLSACCAIHCLLMPVALLIFPLWLGGLLQHEVLHLGFVTLSIFVAAWSFWRGRRMHGKYGLFAFAAVAAALVLFGELFLESAPWWHAAISATAGLALAWGHHLNLRWCDKAACGCPSH